ncbi:MAG: M28 family peptidase [Rubripirellula sp.]
MTIRLVLLCLLLCDTLPGWTQERLSETETDRQSQQLQQLRDDIEYLASEELRGRSVEDDTIDVAANYIAGRMKAIGLDTNLFNGSPFQTLSINVSARPGPPANNRIAIDHSGGAFNRIKASLGEGMNPLSVGSGSGQVVGPVAFVGYGITAPKLNYDDYAGIDASGAIVIVLRKEPGASDPNSPFDGTKNTRHAFFATKIQNAIQHGAAAVILVNDRASVRKQVQEVQNAIDRERARKATAVKQLENLPAGAVNIRAKLQKSIESIQSMIESRQLDLKQAERGVLAIAQAGQRGKDSVPVVSVARDLIDQVLQQARGKSLADLEDQINRSLLPQSFAVPEVRSALRVELKPAVARSSNVIGILPGRGQLAQETVVVGAHYDHVGMGGIGSLAPGTVAIHNGADDNASGTATLLATAATMKQTLAGVASHRRVVFIAFTGEERGLLGSKHYVRNPRFPLDSTTAMVNLDMVGRLRDNELTVYGTGSGEGLEALVERVNQVQKFKLFKVATGYGPSDHQSFYEVGIPVLFFFTGLHNDYHRPSDDFDKIDFGGLTRITDTVSSVTLDLAIRQDRPKYIQTDKKVQIRRQMTAFMGVSLSVQGPHVVISEVVADGPGENGGLMKGDKLVKAASQPIQQPTDVLELMRRKSPGDELKVQLIRDGESMDLTIRLGSRP